MRQNINRLNFKEKMCDTSLFRKMYIITLSLEMIAFLDVVSLAIKCILLSWALFLLIHNYFIEKRAFKVKYKYILWSFLILMVVTSLVHMSVWFVPNLVLAAYTAVCFFMFYGMYTENSHEEIEREMVFLLKFFVVFGAVCAALSLLILFWKRETSVGGYFLGIYKNRLIGIYTNSNILAFSMIEAIVACDILRDGYIKRKFKNIKIKWWITLACTLLCCVCLFLSDSNASFSFLIIYATIRVFCNMFFKNKSSYGIKFLRSILIVVGFCVVMMSVSVALRDVCQNFISETVIGIQKQEESAKKYVPSDFSLNSDLNEHPVQNLQPVLQSEENSADSPEFHIGREHYEVSSGRITLFKQGLEIFKHNPIIGIGRANLTLYSKKYLNGGLIHPDLHNGYLTILVSYGALGLAIFGVFSFVVALDICKHMFACVNSNYFGVFTKLFSALVAYCGYCLFEKAILFDMTFMVGFFWLILGCTISYTHNFEKIPK